MANSLIEDVLNEPINNGNSGSKKTKQKKSKKFIIALIIILLIIIVIAVVAIIYLQQNTSKISDKAKFFEVLGKNNVESISDLDLYSELSEKLMSQNSSSEAEINISYSDEDLSISNITLTLDSENDVENQKYYTNMNLSYSDNDIFNLELLASDEAFALKSDEIVDTFVGATYEYALEGLLNSFETSGYADSYYYDDYDYYYEDDYSYDDTTIETNLENFDISELENIQLPTISEESISIYKNVLDKNLDESQFSSKEVTLNMDSGSVDATEYTLTLSEEEFIDITKEVLEAFETDTETIDSLVDILGLLGLTDSDLITVIDAMIQELDEYEVDETEDVIIKVYDSNNQTVKLSMEYSGVTMEIEYEYGDTENSIKVTSIDNESEEGLSIKFINKKSDLSSDFNIEISIIEDSIVTSEITITTNVLKSGSSYTVTAGIEYKDSDYSLNIDITNDIKFTDVDVDDITTENCILLDDLSEEERETTLNQIFEKAVEVLSEKMNNLSFIDSNSVSGIIEQNEEGEAATSEAAKEYAKEALIEEIQMQMTEAYMNEEEYTIQDLDGLEIEGYEVEVEISNDLAVVTVDGYVFNIDSDFNLSE